MSNEIQEIEVSLEHAKAAVSKGEALRRLMNNPDFVAVVREGYFEKEAIRLVMLKGDPNMQDPKTQAEIIKDIDGIGSFRMYLTTVNQLAQVAANSIAADEETLAELLSEEGNN